MKSKLQTEIDKMKAELVLRLNEVNKYSKTLNAGEQAYKNGRIDQLGQVIKQLSIVTESETPYKREEQKSDGIISSIISESDNEARTIGYIQDDFENGKEIFTPQSKRTAVDFLSEVLPYAEDLERSQPELNTKMKRLMDAVTKLHPTLAMDDPKHEELYLSLHSLKESVTSL